MDSTDQVQNNANEQLHWQSRVERIKEYVAANLANNLDITTVSQKFELSTSTLRHIFKKDTGYSYHYHVEEMRMKKAFELITRDGQRVQQTMYATGYRYKSTFNKAFKKRFGHSPGYFRK